MSHDNLYLNTNQLLNDVTFVFGEESVTLPTRQYIHFGQVAIDCDQLVVEYVGAQRTNVDSQTACTPIYAHTWRVWILRCVPTLNQVGQAPEPADLTSSTITQLTDASILEYGLPRHWKETDNCSHTWVSSVTAYGPSGAISGVIGTIQKSILTNLAGS